MLICGYYYFIAVDESLVRRGCSSSLDDHVVHEEEGLESRNLLTGCPSNEVLFIHVHGGWMTHAREGVEVNGVARAGFSRGFSF